MDGIQRAGAEGSAIGEGRSFRRTLEAWIKKRLLWPQTPCDDNDVIGAPGQGEVVVDAPLVEPSTGPLPRRLMRELLEMWWWTHRDVLSTVKLAAST